MILKDEIVIRTTSDKVWAYVGSPEIWPVFHVKAGECRPAGSRSDVLGALYDMKFRLGSKTSMTRCEIVEYRIGRRITLQSTTAEPKRRAFSALISYELEDQGRETKVTERIEFASAAIPLIFRPLVWLVSRFGKPTGETTLMRLKRLVE